MSAARLGDFAGQGAVHEELLWAGAGGIVYGATATLLGQPLDTIKTKMQTDRLTGRASGRPGTLQVARQILQTAHEGTAGELAHSRPVRKVAGFYRGSLPVLCGSVIFRSVPFTVYSGVYASLPASFATLDPFLGVEGRIWLAGAVAGLGRAVVENPFEVLKTQKQVRGLDYQQVLKARCLWQGLSATCGRNVVLVTLFFVLSDRLHSDKLLLARRLAAGRDKKPAAERGGGLPGRAGCDRCGQTPWTAGAGVAAGTILSWPPCRAPSLSQGARAGHRHGLGFFAHAWPTALPCQLIRCCSNFEQALTENTPRLSGQSGAHWQDQASKFKQTHRGPELAACVACALRAMLLKPCHLTARPTLPREKAPPSSQADATAATARGPRFLLAEGSEMDVREPPRQAWREAKLLRPLPARYTPLRCYEWPPSQVTSSTANSLADAAAKKCAAFRPSKTPGYPGRFSLMNECFGNRAFKVLPPSWSDPGSQERPSSRASAPAKVTTTPTRRQAGEVPIAPGRPRSR
eukprot:s1308_g9.t5